MIKVSVIIPVFNVKEYLRQCLDSVVNQTLREIEIICVDDGSTDGSLGILQEYEKSDSRIHVLCQENKGAGAARNNGMLHASGEFLAFLDSDDFFEQDMLQAAYKKAVSNRNDIVVWHSDIYFQDRKIYLPNPDTINRRLLPDHEPFAGTDIKKDIFHAFTGWPWDKLFRAEFIRAKKIRFQEQRTTNDLLFVYSAIVAAERISTLDKVYAHYRVSKSAGSLSNSRELSWDCFYHALLALRGQLKDWNIYSALEQDFINYSLSFSIWNLETIRGNAFFKLYDKLRNEWLSELGIMDKPESWFYSEKDYFYLCFIREHEANDFLFFILDNMEDAVNGLMHDLNMIFQSNTWKIGSLITRFPGTIKRKLSSKG